MRADSFVFKQKIYCSVLQIEGVGGVTKLVTFCGRQCKPLNGLKLQPIQSLATAVSYST